jgi:hypothetical protein
MATLHSNAPSTAKNPASLRTCAASAPLNDAPQSSLGTVSVNRMRGAAVTSHCVVLRFVLNCYSLPQREIADDDGNSHGITGGGRWCRLFWFPLLVPRAIASHRFEFALQEISFKNGHIFTIGCKCSKMGS